MEGKPLGAMIGGKEQPAQALSRIAVQSTRDLLTDNMEGKWGEQGPRYGAGTDAHKQAIVTEITRLAGSLQAAANFSDAGRQAQAGALSSKIDLSTLHPDIAAMLTQVDWEPGPETKQIDPATGLISTVPGKAVPKFDRPADDKLTLGQAIKNLERTNPEMANTMKIYVEQATAARAAQAAQVAAQVGAQQAAAAQANNPNAIPPVTPPPPTAPTPY